MATRKSGDGSRDMNDVMGDRPGTYVKVSSSRRKKKGKRGRSLIPSAPPSSAPPASMAPSGQAPIADAVDVEGEEVERHAEARSTQPEWGAGNPEADNSVDDLRRKPSSNRAPKKSVGPLGMEDVREDVPTGVMRSPPPRRMDSPRPASPSGRMNVVEINPGDARDNPPDQQPDNSNHAPQHADADAAAALFGDPFESESEPHDAEREADAQKLRAWEQDQISRDGWRAPAELGRQSLSSVFDARASLRPSPPPPPNKVSLLWWGMVSLLTLIIVAAGVIAVREAREADRVARPSAPAPATPARPEVATQAAPVVKAPSPPAAETAPPAAEVAPPAVVAPVVARPTPASVAQPAVSAVAAALPARPRVRRPVAVPAQAAEQAPPAETAPAEAAPALAPPAAEGPAPEEQLPQNPYQ